MRWVCEQSRRRALPPRDRSTVYTIVNTAPPLPLGEVGSRRMNSASIRVRGETSPLSSCPERQGRGDLLEHIVGSRQHVPVPEPQDKVPGRLDCLRTSRVRLDPRRVLSAIQFDRQLRLHTGKVSDVSFDRHLPAKLVTIEAPVPELRPEAPLGIRHVLAQPARETNPLHPLTRSDDGPSSVLDPTSPNGRGDAVRSLTQDFRSNSIETAS